MAEAGRKLSLSAWVWVLIAGLAVFELVAHPLIRAAIPTDDSWAGLVGGGNGLRPRALPGRRPHRRRSLVGGPDRP
ncbi:MAG: hypothetical protein JRE19_15075 [Deltaproteobacteria bacterium]|nr:hypothetical protein [Deltaproteobacteria bacterium]